MIAKDTAPGGNPTPENKIDRLTNSYHSNYLNVSIEEAKKQIARDLLSRPNHTAVSALTLVSSLTHSLDEGVIFARAIHELGKRSLVTLKGNLIKANRRTESVLEGVKE